MVMTSQTIDLIVALLTIPMVNKVLERLPDKGYDAGEYQKIIDAYFQLRHQFEQTYWSGNRP